MHALLTELPLERLAALLRALPEELRAELDEPVSEVLHCRPQALARQPEALRAKALRAHLARNRDADLAEGILRAYFLEPGRRELVTAFLDATGVEHEDGEVEPDAVPDGTRVPAAVAGMLQRHDREDVALYLRLAAWQWPRVEALASAAAQLSPPR